MEGLVSEGLVTSIGVSNLSSAKLSALLRSPQLRTSPAVNQVEAHPGFRNEELLNFCCSRGVHVTAYSSLGSGASGAGDSLLCQPAVIEAARQMGCTAAQALLRWALWRGCSALFKSVDPAHIADNFKASIDHGEGPEEVFAMLSGLEPQLRRHTGATLIRGAQAQFANLAQLWDDLDEGTSHIIRGTPVQTI